MSPRRARSSLRIYAPLMVAALGLACSDDGATLPDVGAPLPDQGISDAPPLDASSRDTSSQDTSSQDASSQDGAPATPCATPSAKTPDRTLYSWLLTCLRSPKPEATRRGAVDLFVARVEASGGFPMVSAGKAAFVYVRSATYDAEDDKYTAEDYAANLRLGPMSVAGAFNGWKAGQHKMKQEPLGVFHAEIPVTLGAARSPYKLVATDSVGKAVWFSDPLSRRFGFDANGRYSLIQGGKDATSGEAMGHLEWIRGVKATKLANSRHIYLYLPPGHDQDKTKRYPVLYMHDGANLFDSAMINANGSWEVDATADAEINAGRAKPFIIVGVPNTKDRMDEYTHVQDTFTMSGKKITTGGKGDEYLDFLVKELKPSIDARYRTLSTKANTAVLGSSLGGLVSYQAGLLHPTVFKYVGGMSSTFGWGQFGQNNATMKQLYAAVTGLKARGQVYYLDSGDNPNNPNNPPTCPNTNVEAEDNYCETVAFRDMLVAAGIKTFPNNPDATPLTPAGIDIYHYHQADAPHSETSWKARFFRPIRLFFRP